MLMTRPRLSNTTIESASVHNYYERLVNDAIIQSDPRALKDIDFLADVSCVALNHLPPRYIRHDVDMSFFMSPVERQETNEKVQQAVNHALAFVIAHEKEKIAAEQAQVDTSTTTIAKANSDDNSEQEKKPSNKRPDNHESPDQTH